MDGGEGVVELQVGEGGVQRERDGLGRQGVVVVDSEIGLGRQTVADDLGASLCELLHEVRVWRFGIIDIGPERQALVAPALHRCVLGTVSPARSVDPVLLAEYLGDVGCNRVDDRAQARSEEHTSELQSLMRISYAVFCLKKKKKEHTNGLKQSK